MSENVRIPLPDSILGTYEKQAASQGIELTNILSDRLVKTVKQTDTKPLYVTDQQRQALERILGRNLPNPQALVSSVEQLALVQVGDTSITLPTDLLKRIKSRCFKMPIKEVLQREITIALERFVGLR